MKREKTVFPKDEVAHLFAHQRTTNARDSRTTFYVDGHTIYSYGSHFPIAKHVTNKKKEKALLFTTRTYSNTTAKHKSIVRSACSHLNIIYCYNPNCEHDENIEFYIKLMKNELSGLSNSRKPEKQIEPAKEILNDLKKYCEFFSIKVPKTAIHIIDSAQSGEYAEYLNKERKRIEAEQRRKEKRKLEAFKVSLSKWRDNITHRLFDKPFGFDYLRYNGKRVETSQGVEIPLEIAKKAFDYIMDAISKGGCRDCDYSILDYNINHINNDEMSIGCHTFEISEIKNIAKQLNWL